MGPTDRHPTLAEVGLAKLVGHICRVVCGKGVSIEELKKKATASTAAPPASPTSPSSAVTRKIKLSAVLSQIDET